MTPPHPFESKSMSYIFLNQGRQFDPQFSRPLMTALASRCKSCQGLKKLISGDIDIFLINRKVVVRLALFPASDSLHGWKSTCLLDIQGAPLHSYSDPWPSCKWIIGQTWEYTTSIMLLWYNLQMSENATVLSWFHITCIKNF